MQKRASVWSFAIGMAFFAMSLGIFLPFAAALAGGNGNFNPALTQICTIGGVKTVSPASTDLSAQKHVSNGHEYCPYCGFSNAAALVSDGDTAPRYLVLIEKQKPQRHLDLLIEYSEKGFLIRGPPVLS